MIDGHGYPQLNYFISHCTHSDLYRPQWAKKAAKKEEIPDYKIENSTAFAPAVAR